jgi:uncharacterized protein
MAFEPLTTATAGHRQIPPDWISASQVSPLIFADPGLVWLEYHGAEHGFQPDESPYEFIDFISRKGRQFEEAWLRELAPGAGLVCSTSAEVRDPEKIRGTFELMRRGVPVIAQPALWWTPERVYGVPDLLVHSAWLQARFPELLTEQDARVPALHLSRAGEGGHYLVMDLKFTTKLEGRAKSKDLENYAAQVRLYSYMLGQLQGVMPKNAYLVARDRIADPLPVEITSQLDQPLDADLRALRDLFLEIKLNGAKYCPWVDDIVSINTSHHDDRWHTAKSTIARDRVPGGDASQLYYIGQSNKGQLAELGYPSLASLLAADPSDIPFEELKRIGAKTAARMRAVLQANRSNSPVMPPAGVIPSQKSFEFFVDYEYFTNVNVDFEAQWPTLEGQEMIFMVGLGWEFGGEWRYETIIAAAEDSAQELAMFDRFIQRLDDLTGGSFTDGGQTALYHWTGAEVWQSKRAAERHQLPADHPLRKLPWVDLQKAFLDGPGAIPGSWDFGLKSMAKALSEYDPQYAAVWPGELDEGLRVMVMGWGAYQDPQPLETYELQAISQYLETDCKALWQILGWLRGIN